MLLWCWDSDFGVVGCLVGSTVGELFVARLVGSGFGLYWMLDLGCWVLGVGMYVDVSVGVDEHFDGSGRSY